MTGNYPAFSVKVLNSYTIVSKFTSSLGLTFYPDGEYDEGISPLDIFDYTVAILSSNSFTSKYRKELEVDFPILPYPLNTGVFIALRDLGAKFRQSIQLLTPHENIVYAIYPEGGSNLITRKITAKDCEYLTSTEESIRVWINDEQYFDNL